MAELAEANHYEIEEDPDKILADAGFCSQANLEYMDQPGSADPCIAVKKDHKQRGENVAATRGRIPKDMSRKKRMEPKVRTKAGKTLCRLRDQIPEAPYGQINDCSNLDKFLLVVLKSS